MKLLIIIAISILSLSKYASGQSPTPSQVAPETKGVCSPIAENNQGSITITCTGFSEKQNKQILDFLHRLSLKQSNDQDILLSKLNEIMDTVKATQRLNSPRIISDELQQQILRAAWETCAPEQVLIIAPSGDTEAQNLASQLRNILARAGLQSSVVYRVVKKEPGSTEDMKIINNVKSYCVVRFLGGGLDGHFSVGLENRTDTNNSKIPVYLYVYPR